MFWVMFSPIIRSTWLYLQFLVVLTQVAAGWCHGWVFNSSVTPWRKLLTNLMYTFDVHKSVRHHTIQINQPTRCSSFTSLSLDVYVWLNMFWAPLCLSSGAYNCTRSLWFYHWRVATGAWLVDHDQQHCNRHAAMVKPEAPSAVVCFWWWADRHPKHIERHINVK